MERTRRKERIAAIVLGSWLLMAMNAAPALAHCWELGLKVMPDTPGWAVIPITIHDNATGAVVFQGYSGPTGDQWGVNFRINLNSACLEDDVDLIANKDYTIIFGSWGSVYFKGTLPGDNDAVWKVTPSGITHVSGNPLAHKWNHYKCAVTAPQITITGTQVHGSKTTYFLSATCPIAINLGGSCTRSYSWSGATMTSLPGVQPSTATRTLLAGQNGTVTATLTVPGGWSWPRTFIINN